MASTPPLQITATPQTPPTPLHGAAYDRPPVRQSSRIKERIASSAGQKAAFNGTLSTPRRKRSSTTPESTPRPVPALYGTAQTPKKAARRVQVISPDTPNTRTTPVKKGKPTTSHLQPFLSSTTTMSEGMLPTPVKTPKKKEVSNVKPTSRALFQDDSILDEMMVPGSRKTRKNKRYNGYSLESFRVDEGDSQGIQIFTDTRDKVPELDSSKANPFNEEQAAQHAQKLTGGTKRRKISSSKGRDPQVEAAIEQDDGMVYVFRGKKVFRRFADEDEEEEEIDELDLGLLESATIDGQARKPIKTLTRKSIKPTRLFQSEGEKVARERETEEEALTDVEDQSSASIAASPTSKTKPNDKSVSPTETQLISKKTSPFNQWTRAKKSLDGSATRSGKRSATDAFEQGSPGAQARTSVKRTARA